MKKALLTLSLISSCALAEETEVSSQESSVLPALKVLPAGSELSGVSIPRYNSDYSPASMLKAKLLTIISKTQIQGTDVDIKIYDEDGITFSGVQFITTSQGLILDWKNNRGFFLGKNYTIVYLKESISMKAKKNKQNNSPSKAISAIAATTLVASTNALNALTVDEIKEIDHLSKPSTEKIEQLNAQVSAQISEATTASDTADRSQAALVKTINDSNPTLINAIAPEAPFVIPPELKPEKGKDHFSIKSQGNIFFDAQQGMMVFKDKVKVTHPEYRFSCDGEVKLLLAAKNIDPKLKPEEIKELKPNERFDGINKIIATENVSIYGKDDKGNPISARAGSLVYDHPTGVIILRGLNSRINSPDKQLKIVEKNGYIKIDKNWNVSGQGTQIDLNIEQLKKNTQ